MSSDLTADAVARFGNRRLTCGWQRGSLVDRKQTESARGIRFLESTRSEEHAEQGEEGSFGAFSTCTWPPNRTGRCSYDITTVHERSLDAGSRSEWQVLQQMPKCVGIFFVQSLTTIMWSSELVLRRTQKEAYVLRLRFSH